MFFEESRAFYDPSTTKEDFMYSTPKFSAKFNVWDPSEMILFYKNRKIGVKQVDMTKFSDIYLYPLCFRSLGLSTGFARSLAWTIVSTIV